MKQCVSCLQWKDGTEFNWRYRALGIRHATCRECQNELGDTWYQNYRDREHERGKIRKHRIEQEAQEYAYNYLSTHPCTMCGESDPTVLEFHTVGGKGWILNSSLGGGNTLVALQAEISKCIVLCANCHRKTSNDEPIWLKSTK